MDFIFLALKLIAMIFFGLYFYLLIIRILGFKMAVWVKMNVLKEDVPENERKIKVFGKEI